MRITPVVTDDVLALSGDSGGAVFIGDLRIGILTFATEDIQNDAYFMPIERVVNAGYDVVPAP